LRTIVTLSLAAGSLLASLTALQAAPTQAQQQAIRSSCQNDYRTYCASVPTGGAEALQCLEKNVASLSSACQQAVKAASGGGSSTATESGSASSGGSTASGSGGTATKAPTSTAPAATAPAAKPPVIIVLEPGQEIALMRQACGADYRTYCAGVRVIGGGALSCLVSHAPGLSSGCKSVLSKLGQRF
jgi:hypothetical protein